MFRLLVLLCAGIFATMLIAGEDRGQLRFGLMAQPGSEEAPVVVVAAPAAQAEQDQIVAVSFAPEKPVMTTVTIAEPVAEAAAAAPVADEVSGEILYVNADSVNVRQGPGKDHSVIGRLPRGEAVLVLVSGEGPEGWSLIRVEGDGIEGYVAARLLAE
jgi:uncharacterized protein YgiM (DUF1202 family)